MPIFMKYEGIHGYSSHHQQGGRVNPMMKDGSVRFVRDSISKSFGGASNGGGPKVTAFSGSDTSGVIEVSRISFPNSPSGAVDALAPNAVAQARIMFEAQRSMVTTLGVVFSIPKNGANKFRHTNNLRQISLAALRKISTVKLLITDIGNPRGVTVELENVLITNYSSISATGGDAHASETLAINFVKVK